MTYRAGRGPFSLWSAVAWKSPQPSPSRGSWLKTREGRYRVFTHPESGCIKVGRQLLASELESRTVKSGSALSAYPP